MDNPNKNYYMYELIERILLRLNWAIENNGKTPSQSYYAAIQCWNGRTFEKKTFVLYSTGYDDLIQVDSQHKQFYEVVPVSYSIPFCLKTKKFFIIISYKSIFFQSCWWDNILQNFMQIRFILSLVDLFRFL